MKKLIFLLIAALSTFSAFSQFDSSRYSRPNSYGIVYKRGGFDSVLLIPIKNPNQQIVYRKGALRFDPADNSIEVYNGTSWIKIIGGEGSGEVNTGSNAGTGAGIFKGKVDVDLVFKSLIDDNTITLVAGTNEIMIKADTSVLSTRYAVTGLARAALSAGSGIAISPTGVISTIAAPDGSATRIIPGQNNLSVTGTGTLQQPYQINVKNFNDSVFLKGGTDSVFNVIGGVPRFAFLLPTGGGTGGESNTASNLGGVGLYKQKSGVTLDFKGLTSDANLTLTPNANDVQISVNLNNISSVQRLIDSLVEIRNDMAAGGIQTETDPTIPTGTSAQYIRGDRTLATLNKAAVGLGSVDNTPDASKPVSTLQAAAIATKEPLIAAGTSSQVWMGDKVWRPLDKSTVGLSNVDNTPDASKPISSAQQAALNLKANISSLAPVATTGNYNDLVNKPLIPGDQVNADWNATSGKAQILNKPTIPTNTNQLTNGSDYVTGPRLADSLTALGNRKENLLTMSTGLIRQLNTVKVDTTLLATRWWSSQNQTPAGVTSFNGRSGAVVPGNNDYTTSMISEGTNQYFTQGRVRTSISAGAGIAYNNATGVISSTITQADGTETKINAGTNISVTGNGSGSLPYTISAATDNWGSQVVAKNPTLVGNGTSGSPLGADTSNYISTIPRLRDSIAKVRLDIIPIARSGFSSGAGISIVNGVVSSTITQANGSETKITAGANIQVTGSGTQASPYIITGTLSGGGTPPGDQWGTQIVEHDATMTGGGTGPNPLKVDSLIMATRAFVLNRPASIWGQITGDPTAQADMMNLFNGKAPLVHGHPGSQITEDAAHRWTTDAEKAAWNAKQNALGYTPVPDSRTVNSKPLTTNITLNKSDIGLPLVPNVDATARSSHTGTQPISTISDFPSVTGQNGKILSNTGTSLLWINLPTASVTSVFGRSGTVIAQNGDYTFAQIGSKPTTRAGYGITDAEATITATSAADYFRGDKVFAPLNKAAVGLNLVDNTSDASKPVSTLQQTALNLKVDLSRFFDSLAAHRAIIPLTTSNLPEGGNKYFTEDRGRALFRAGANIVITADGEISSTGGGGGIAGVASFNNRVGNVIPQLNDYTFAQIGAKPTTRAGYGITDAEALLSFSTGLSRNVNTIKADTGILATNTSVRDSLRAARQLMATFLTAESDPTVNAAAKTITETQKGNWNAAFGWGNHAGLYPLLAGSYVNPTWIASLPYSKITGTPTIPTQTSQLTNNSNFITTEADPFFTAANANLVKFDGLYGNPNFITSLAWSKITGAPTFVNTASSYSNPTWLESVAWGKVTGAPAFITAAGETDPLAVKLAGSYTNPTWLVSVPWSKITSAPSFLTAESDPLAVKLAGSYTNPSWLASIPASKVTGLTTDAVTEGTTNLYYTTARARSAFTAGTNISIVNGVISSTGTGGGGIQTEADPVYLAQKDGLVQTALTYNNPAWLATLAHSKVSISEGVDGNLMFNNNGILGTAPGFKYYSSVASASIGSSSISGAFARNSAVIGYFNTITSDTYQGVTGTASMLVGANNSMTSPGVANLIVGQNNTATSAYNSLVVGSGHTTNGFNVVTLGESNKAKSYSSLYAGRYATEATTASPDSWVATDPLFVIGNGTGETARSNALEMLKNGNLTLAGSIRSLSGGFIFPDGTVQLTAATGGGGGGGGAEVDPTVPSAVKAITSTNINSWNQAVAWGNHSGLYPSVLSVHNDPTWLGSLAASKVQFGTNISNRIPFGSGSTLSTQSDFLFNSSTGHMSLPGRIIPGGGIEFPDGTVQTTAGSGGGGDGNNFLNAAGYDPGNKNLFLGRQGLTTLAVPLPIPTLTSELSNDAGFVTSGQTWPQSQITGLTGALAAKQNALTAGTNITIVDNVISATTSGGVAGVTTVNGRDGAVTLSKTDVALGNVQNVDQTNASNLSSGTIPTDRIANNSLGVTKLSATGTKSDKTVLFGDNVFREITGLSTTYQFSTVGVSYGSFEIPTGGDLGNTPESGVYEFTVSGNNYASGGTDVCILQVSLAYGNPTGSTVQTKNTTFPGLINNIHVQARTGSMSNGQIYAGTSGRNLLISVTAADNNGGTFNWKVEQVSKVKHFQNF